MRKNYTNFNKPTDDISVVIQPFLVTIKNLILEVRKMKLKSCTLLGKNVLLNLVLANCPAIESNTIKEWRTHFDT